MPRRKRRARRRSGDGRLERLNPISAFLMTSPGFNPATWHDDALADLSDDEVMQWIEEHRDQLAAIVRKQRHA